MCVCMFVRMLVCARPCVYVCVRVCAFVHMCFSACACMFVSLYMCMRVCVGLSVCVCAREPIATRADARPGFSFDFHGMGARARINFRRRACCPDDFSWSMPRERVIFLDANHVHYVLRVFSGVCAANKHQFAVIVLAAR